MALRQTDNVAAEAPLILRCREVNDIARQVSELVRNELEAVAESAQIYTFKDRLKPTGSILEKVYRKRAEARTLQSKRADFLRATDKEREQERDALRQRILELESYGPDHITDAWGCRFVTLFQDQIPTIIRAILARLEAFNGNSAAKVTLKEFVIYTSQLPTSQLSIVSPTLTVLRESGLASSVVIDEKAIRKPENKKSAYSSVHMILCAPMIVDHPGRGSTNEIAQFEIQVRDIFEEGWGEIEHFLVYSARERTGPNGSHDEEERPWQGFLSVLKTHIDGCSSSASLINRAAQADGRTKMPTLNTKSATHREVDRKAVLDTLHGKVPGETLTLIDEAYQSLIVAETAETKDDAVSKFVAAAGLFEQAIIGVGDRGETRVGARADRPVTYFLKIELANCYLYGGMVHKLDEAIAIYESLKDRFPEDPVPHVRYAKALVAKDPTRANFEKANDTLLAALELIPRDPLTGPNHWMQMSTLIQLGWNHWKLSVDYAKAEEQSGQLVHLKEAVQWTLKAYSFWTQLGEDYASGETDRLLAHKALSNVLYYAARLHDLTPKDPDFSPDRIRQWIKQLQAIAVPPYRDFYRTQDNMMHASASINDTEHARSLANDIYGYLKKTAERRAGRVLKFDDIPNHLDAEERTPFMSAVGVMLGNT